VAQAIAFRGLRFLRSALQHRRAARESYTDCMALQSRIIQGLISLGYELRI
jgi:hypothetical protein